ncbi:MAG: phosphatase PAP2 family protein [Polyangiales bacterium]
MLTLVGASASAESVQGEPDQGNPNGAEQPTGPAETSPVETSGHRLQWRWKRVHWAEVGSTVALAGGAIGLSFVKTPTPRWDAVNSFDSWVRGGIGLEGRAQHRIDRASDVFALTLVAFPVLVDSFGVALIGDKNQVVFWQLAAIQAQAFATTGFLTNAVKVTARRQRPFAQDLGCEADPSDPACRGGTNRSFFSGHTAFAFTGAGLTCVTHRHLALYGRIGDPLACATSLTFASLTGLFRVMADAHWMTDTIAGAGVGLFSGWLMPWLLHFRHDRPRYDGARGHVRHVAPYGSRTEVGVQLSGRF